jgi:translocation and assembly module TamA
VRALAAIVLLAGVVPMVALAQGDDESARVGNARGEERAGESRPLTVTWQAPQPLRDLFEQFLKPPAAAAGERRGASLRPWIRDVRKRVPEIAASEGYFSATVDIEFDGAAREHATVTVTPGPRTTVASIDIEFRGDLATDSPQHEARREQLRGAFAMKVGEAFRSPDWDVAKTRLTESLRDLDYAAGELASSKAEVDAEAARATLHIVLDSGPPFTLGDVEVTGLKVYSESTIRRLVDLKRGERFNMERLTTLQRLIQTGPWFSSVVVEIERDPLRPNFAPVHINVAERSRQEIGLSVGYGTDDGARAEAAYRNRDLFHRFDLQSSVKLAQKEQIGYADFYMPPGLAYLPRYGTVPFTDSFGVLAQHNDINNLVTRRIAFAGYRHFRLDKFETQVGLSYQVERTIPLGADEQIRRALAPVVMFTWRFVDNPLDPRRGGVLNVQFAAGSRALASGDDFLKTYAQMMYWIPLGPIDQLLLRAEVGRTYTANSNNIPEDFLFTAGGSRSNRGYAYQSLGVQQGDAIVGGRYLATGTVEYVHWFNDKWGGAVFTDIGDASDSIASWQPLKSYGVGARFRTPAGPFALDLAYAARDHKFRLAFSVNIAF